MNSTLITMNPEQAEKKLKAYRSRLHKDTEKVYAECAEAYKAMAAGIPLIELTQAIREGGFDARFRPRLAVGPADKKEVRFTWSRHDQVGTFAADFSQTGGLRSPRLTRRIDMGRRPETYVDAYARVPMLPADVRPKTGQLKDWHILWQVTDWSDRPHTAEPPRDPYLLKHIGGDLYAVLAEWDLTDLERAIMRNQVLR